MLKMLEDPPEHVYFMLCTTEPEKLLSTVRQRCTSIGLKPIKEKDITEIVSSVCKKERMKLRPSVFEKIVEYAEGSAREALQLLDKVYQLESEDDQLEAIEKASLKAQGISLARLLINKKTKWNQVAPLLKELRSEEPERIRYIILGYAVSVVLNKPNERAITMIEAFRDNFYDCKFAGVVAACYEMLNGE